LSMKTAKKRLCIVTPAHWRVFMGGSQYQIKCLLDELLRLDRFEITYLANRIETDSRIDDYGIVPIGRKMPRFGYMMHAIPLYQALQAIRPDLIYQRVACGYTGIAAYFARHNNSKLIWHVAHDSDVTPGSSMHGRNPVRRFLEKRSVEYGIRHASQIITQTEDQAALLRSNYNRAAAAVIPNFHPAPPETIDKSGALSVLWVANIKPWKQPEAFVQLAETLSDLQDVRFTMVGALMTSKKNRQWAESLLKRINETPNLDYLGQKSQDEVNELMARAHIFVNTSKQEGFANTFIQAWMREVPVVSLHVNPDGVFDREKVGIHAGSHEQLCRAVRLLLTNTIERKEYADCARVYAARRHSLQNARQLAELIDSASTNGSEDKRIYPSVESAPGISLDD
jgi:glycosyltransferase involved in cell wall biosynthesis